MGITDIVPPPENYGSFVDLVDKPSRQNIHRGCRTIYICGLTDETKKSYMRTTKCSSKMTHSTVKQQQQTLQRNCRSLAEEAASPDRVNILYTHQQESVENHHPIVEELRVDSTTVQGDS